MNLKDYLSVTPEIQEAIDAGKPVVALESTILSHGMPYPQNVEFAHKVEEIVRAEGAVPATTAIMGGKLKVGLNAEELLVMCKAEGRRQGQPPRCGCVSGNRHDRRDHCCDHP